MTGIDFADEIIKSAQNRTHTKKERLRFQRADLNDLPDGQFAAFYTYKRKEWDTENKLKLESNQNDI